MWFLAAIGVTERFLRDLIQITITLVGRTLLSDALLKCTQSPRLDMPSPDLTQLIQYSDLDTALGELTYNFMDRGAQHTTHYAAQFAEALGTSLFPAIERGVQPGILSKLSSLGGSSERTWIRLIEAKTAMTVGTTQEARTNSKLAPLEDLYGLGPDQLQLLAEYLCAFGFGFAMRISAATAKRAEQTPT